MKKLINKIRNFCNQKAIAAKTAIQSVKAEGYVDTGVKIINRFRMCIAMHILNLLDYYGHVPDCMRCSRPPFFPISTPRSARCSIIPAPDPETVRR